ncbi:MAG: discoidin domain-containing protein [Pirellulales bacterium]
MLFFSLPCISVRAAQVNAVIGHGAAATQSTTNGGFVAGLAANGLTTDFTHTVSGDPNPTWQIDLGASIPLDSLTIYNRGGGCCQSRLRDITVEVFDFAGNSVYLSPLLNAENVLGGGGTGGPPQLDIPALGVLGRTIKITRTPDPDLSGTGGVGNADEGSVLSIGEVVGLANNLALNQPVTESSNIGYAAANGNNDNVGDFTHTSSADLSPFWQVDLGDRYNVDSVVIHNRDGCCNGRLRDITVDILAADGSTVVYSSPLLNPDNALGGGDPNNYATGPETLALDLHELVGNAVGGQFVRVGRTPSQFVSGNADDAIVLSMGEVQVFGSPVPEPSTVALAGMAAIALFAAARRRRSV